MAQTKKPTQSEIDGVQYRRVPTWCIAIAEMQAELYGGSEGENPS